LEILGGWRPSLRLTRLIVSISGIDRRSIRIVLALRVALGLVVIEEPPQGLGPVTIGAERLMTRP
jgi:hypothetical protein